MKIPKKRSIIQRSGIFSLAIMFVAASVFSLIEPTLTEAAKPRYSLAHSIDVAEKSGDFGNVDTGADGSVYISTPYTPTNGTTIEKYSSTGTLEKSFNVTMRGSVTVGNDNSIYLTGVAEAVGEVVQKYNQNGDIVARFTSPDGGYFSNGVAIGSDGTVYVLRKNVTEMYSSNGTYIGKWSHSYGDGGRPSIVVDGSYVYITLGSDAITKFNLDGTVAGYLTINNTTDTIGQMRIKPNGNLLLSNAKSNQLIEMTNAGAIVDRTDVTNWPDVQLANNWKATVDASGSITIADFGMNVITRFSQTGTQLNVMDQNTDGKLNHGNGSVGTDSSGNVYVSDGKFIQKFNKDGQFIKRIGGGGPASVDGKFSAILRIAISPSGDIYAYDNLNYQFQKFDSNGNFIAKWGSYGSGDGQVLGDIRDMKVGSSGNLYVADNANMRIQVFSSSGQYVTHWSGSGGANNGPTTPLAIGTDTAGNVYTSEHSDNSFGYPHFFRKYNASGTLLREWTKQNSSADNNLGGMEFSIAIDQSGNIYTNAATPGNINFYDSEGVYQSQFRSGDSGFYNQFILGTNNAIIDSGESGVRQFVQQGYTQAPDIAQNLAANSTSYDTARISWDAPEDDGGDSVTHYDIEIRESSNDSWDGAQYYYKDAVGLLYSDITNLTPGVAYEVRVRAVNGTGTGAYSFGSFNTPAIIIPPKNITSIDVVDDESGKSLIVNGTGLVGVIDPYEYAEAVSRSLVTLNGSQMKFCSNGLESTYVEYGYDPNYFSDNAPCYEIFDANTGQRLITPTKATIRLTDDFDLTAQGTVSVNGSNTFTFNQQTTNPDGNEEPAEPSVIVNNKPLEGKPTINERPTFSGVAEPGATVTVTVRSDPIVCTTTADSNGNWSCTLPSDLPPGDHTVTVRIVNPDNSIDELGPYAVIVIGSGAGVVTPATPLAPNTGEGRMLGLQNNHISYSVVGLSIVFALVALVTHIKQSQSAKRLRRTSLML